MGEQKRWQRVLQSKLFEHFLVGAGSRLCPPDDRQLEVNEQNLLQLFGRIDVEFPPGLRVNLAFDALQPLCDIAALVA